MQSNSQGFFLSFFKRFFSINKNERKKFILMSCIMFGILYIYGTLRAMRDSIIVPQLGAIYLSFIDLYFICPFSVIFSLLYAKMTNCMRREQIFYSILSFYFVAFSIFGLILYPNLDYFHLDDHVVQQFSSQYPNLKYFAVLVGKWCYVFFGILVEMWMPTVFIILFWQYANHIVSSDQAKRFYPSFGIISNAGLVVSGYLIKLTSSTLSANQFVMNNIIIIDFFILMMMFVFYKVNNHVKIIYHNKIDTSSKLSLPLLDSIKLILKSKYLRFIFIMIVGYGIINNILEIQWKAKLKEYYTDTNQYAHFMGNFTMISGYTLIFLSMVSSQIVQNARWRTAAKIPAIIAVLACLTFYPLNVFEELISPMVMAYIPSFLQFICTISTISIVLMKCSKFTFFDTTREMVYIPLDPELKVKGKAVVDLLGSKFTIAGGSFLQSSILMVFPMINPKLYSGILGIFSIFMGIIWIMAINNLNREYTDLLKLRKEEEEALNSNATSIEAN